MSRHWAKHREGGLLISMHMLIWIYNRGGRLAFGLVLLPVMAYFFLRRGDARRASRDYLMRVRRCYPEVLGNRPLVWLSFRQFMTFGQTLLDKYLAWVQPQSGIVMDPEQEKMLFDAIASGRGSMVIGSHFGNLEYSRGIAHRHPTLIMNVLIYDRHAQKFAALLEHYEPESRINLMQVTDLDFALALRLKEKVENGEWVAIAGDRVPVNAGGRVCDAEFLGDVAKFPVGPYVLASLLQCPVYLLHCFRDAGRYRLVMEFFDEQVQLPRDNRQLAFEANAQKFATALERQVAQAPLQWFNFFDFWSAEDLSGRKTAGAAN
jgi:predicted LPLAT superfamily acyltransferase